MPRKTSIFAYFLGKNLGFDKPWNFLYNEHRGPPLVGELLKTPTHSNVSTHNVNGAHIMAYVYSTKAQDEVDTFIETLAKKVGGKLKESERGVNNEVLIDGFQAYFPLASFTYMMTEVCRDAGFVPQSKTGFPSQEVYDGTPIYYVRIKGSWRVGISIQLDGTEERPVLYVGVSDSD